MTGHIISLFGLPGRKWSVYFLRKWGASVCFILNLDVKVQGNPPEPPFFLVSNHLSYVDIMMLLSKLKCVFIAKSDVANWPFFGFMTRTVGMLFVNREKRSDVKRVNDLIARNINEAQGLLLFPESTTSAGKEVLPFKASLLAYPAEMKMPVHYASITYATAKGEPHASNSVCWWGDVTFFSHFIDLLKLKKISGTISFGDEPILENDRKELAKELYKKVNSQFIPVIDKKEYAEIHGSS